MTYEGEHLGYVCNHGSLNREQDAVVQAIPYLDSVSNLSEIARGTQIYYAHA